MKYFIIITPAAKRAINLYPIFFFSLIITLYNLYFSECHFGKTLRELGSTWYADLGPPFGVMYCIKCECVPVSVNRLLVVFSTTNYVYFFLVPTANKTRKACRRINYCFISCIFMRETHVYILFIYT